MSRSAPQLLILRTGHTSGEVIARHGDFDRWFVESMEGLGCRFTVRHVPTDGVGHTAAFDGVLVTGTPASVRDQDAWMRDLGDLLSAPGRVPVLAVCFAAQLAADALGGRVERNPTGWEIGTIDVEFTAAGERDPLFAGLPATLRVQSTHEDAITHLPDGTTLLAGNEHTRVQAFARGLLRAVQFHPEASAAALRLLVELRREILLRDTLEHGAASADEARKIVDGIAAGVRETGTGRRILANWVDAFVRQQQPDKVALTR